MATKANWSDDELLAALEARDATVLRRGSQSECTPDEATRKRADAARWRFRYPILED